LHLLLCGKKSTCAEEAAQPPPALSQASANHRMITFSWARARPFCSSAARQTRCHLKATSFAARKQDHNRNDATLPLQPGLLS
jgi:hypothetical protein